MISEHSAVVIGTTGLITTGAIGFFLAPDLLLKFIFAVQVPSRELILLTRHWGFMVFLLGLLLVWAAFEPLIRIPVVLMASTEKLMFAVLVWRGPMRVRTLRLAAVGDALLAVLLVFWLLGL
jgi:hypothetical protein